MKHTKKWLSYIGIGILFFTALIFIGIASYKFFEFKTGEAVYDDLEDNYTGTDNKDDESDSQENTTNETDDFSVDWDALFARNKDVVGWIRTMSGASYPILHGETNETYLYHDIDHNYNINGSIFLYDANSGEWYDKNSIVYGHNMNSGAMFGTNRTYKDELFAQENPYFYIYTPEGRYRYRIFTAVITQDASACYNPYIRTKEEMKEFLDTIKKESIYTLAEAQPEDHIVTLSTCTGRAHGDTRFLIYGYVDEFRKIDGTIETREELQFKMRDKLLRKEAEEFDAKHGRTTS